MNNQAIAKVGVLLVAALMTSSVMAQGVIKYEFKGTYSFHLGGKQWGVVRGLNFDVRQSFSSLLGEPVTNNNVRYWFGRGPFEPSIDLFREVSQIPSAEGALSTPNGERWAFISIENVDSISVNRTTGGSLKVSYPYERFIDRVRIVSAHFVGRYELAGRNQSVELLGGFNGVFGAPGKWGWNFPGSPSWNRALVSRYNFINRGTKPVSWYSSSQARNIFGNVINSCQAVCEGHAMSLQDLNLNIHGLLNDIAVHSEDFRVAYYTGDPRITVVNSLLAAAQAEPDTKIRRRRQALANRAMEAFGDQTSQAINQHWAATASERQQTATEQAMAMIDDAFCQMMADGKVEKGNLAKLQRLVRQRGGVPTLLQKRAEESLKLLSKEGMGAGDIQVTLTWDHGGTDLWFIVEMPDGYSDDSVSDGIRTNGFSQWVGSAKAGKYLVKIQRGYEDLVKYHYKLRIQYGSKVITDSDFVYSGTSKYYDFTVDQNQISQMQLKSAGRQRCQNFTEL